MKKRLLAALLCLCMAAALLPSTALADVIKYNVRMMDGSRFRSDALTRTCGSGTATLDVMTTPYTLTLENATITPYGDSNLIYGIYAETDLKLVLVGTNVISSAESSAPVAYGIYTSGNLTISGSGSLTVTSGIPTGSTTTSYGIYTKESLTFDSDFSGTVTAKCADGSSLTDNCGIYVSNDMTVSSGTVTAESGLAVNCRGLRVKGELNVTGGAVTAKGGCAAGSATYSYGLHADGSVIVSGGSLTAHSYAATRSNYGIHTAAESSGLTVETGAVVAASCDNADESDSCAIYTKSFELTGGELTATGGGTNGNSYGLRCIGALSVSGGTLTANSGVTATESSLAIKAETSFALVNGTVTATGGSTAGDSCGVFCTGPLSVSGGTLTASGVSDASPETNYGVYAGGNTTISNGAVIAHGGAASETSIGYFAHGAIGVSGGEVTATSGSVSAGNSYALYAKAPFTLEYGTVDATSGSASETSIGVYCIDDIDVSGGELTANANSSGSNYGVATLKSVNVSGGSVTANGAASSTSSYGVRADGGLTCTGGETTATGNLRAVSLQPAFGTTDPTWYKWKVNTTASAPTGAYTRSRIAAYTRTSYDQYLSIVPDPSTAAIASATVSGATGAALVPMELTVSLTEERFNALNADADVSGWFTNLPASLSAKLQTAVLEGASSAVVTISGTPTQASAAPIALTIPAAALESDAALPSTENADAKWAILASASVSPVSSSFDKYVSAAGCTDKDFTLTPGSYFLSALKIGEATLTETTDYTVIGSTYTIKKETLAALTVGTHTVTFDMNGGADPEVTLTVSNSAPTSYTITYDSRGGSGTMADSIVPIGTPLTLPECGFTPPANGRFKEWAVGAESVAPGASYTFTASTTVYAVWEAPKGAISGTVTDGEQPIENVTVKVFRGNEKLAETITDTSGEFLFTNLYYGVYSLVGTKDGKMVTDIITVKQDETIGNLILPATRKNTVVEIAQDAPPVAVKGLNDLYQDHNLVSDTVQDNDKKGITTEDMAVVAGGGSVELKLAAEAKVIESSPDSNSDQGKITETLGSDDSLALLVELSVTKTVTAAEGDLLAETALTELPQLVDIYVELPVSLRSRTGLKVLRVHGGEVQALPYDGESFSYTDDGIYLVLHVRRFSSYGVAQDNNAPLFVPVTGITFGGTQSVTANTALTLSAAVAPVDATNQTIVWSLKDAGTANGSVENGVFRASAAGTSTVTATIINGKTQSGNYTQDFTITVYTAYSDTYYDSCIITASAGLGGVITPSGSVSVREGQGRSFTITPETGYVISDVLVDGVSVRDELQNGTYTFENVRRDHTIFASFRVESEAGEVNPFTDVKEADWFFTDVMFVFNRGLMLGTGDTMFSPSVTTTRMMVVVTLWRMNGSPAVTGTSGFSDVPEDAWYAVPLTWAVQNGIAKGYGNGLFGPNNPVIREQLAAFFFRYAAYRSCDTTASASLAPFADRDDISGYAVDAVGWAIGSGLMKGISQTKLEPLGDASRAQFAAMLHRFVENDASAACLTD